LTGILHSQDAKSKGSQEPKEKTKNLAALHAGAWWERTEQGGCLMQGRISIPGVLLGIVAALWVGLWMHYDSFTRLIIGMILGIPIGVVLLRREPKESDWRKGERE
jgi:hypothetical protein